MTDSFGNTIVSSGSAATPFGFGGQSGYQTDADTGLKFCGARYYDSSFAEPNESYEMIANDKQHIRESGCFDLFKKQLSALVAGLLLAPSIRHHSYPVVTVLLAIGSGLASLYGSYALLVFLQGIVRKRPEVNLNLIALGDILGSATMAAALYFYCRALLLWWHLWIPF